MLLLIILISRWIVSCRPTVPSSIDLLVGDSVFRIEVKCLESDSSTLSGRLASVAVPASHEGAIPPPLSEDQLDLAADTFFGERVAEGRRNVDLSDRRRLNHRVQAAVNEPALNSYQHSLPTSVSFEGSNLNLPLLDLDPSWVQPTPTVHIYFSAQPAAYSLPHHDFYLEYHMRGFGLETLGRGQLSFVSNYPSHLVSSACHNFVPIGPTPSNSKWALRILCCSLPSRNHTV